MRKEYEVQRLTSELVFIVARKYGEVEGTEYKLGDDTGAYYYNSASGRAQIAAELPEPYLSAVMAVWGEEPTVKEGDSLT